MSQRPRSMSELAADLLARNEAAKARRERGAARINSNGATAPERRERGAALTNGNGASAPDVEIDADAAERQTRLADPDMSVLRLNLRPPPECPVATLGPLWARWINRAADAAAAPVDYVLGPLLATASVLVGNSRWAGGWPGWREPPQLWLGDVGESGQGKSPGSDVLHRDILPTLESRMGGDFTEQHREWVAAEQIRAARRKAWEQEVLTASKKGLPPPLPPAEDGEPEPMRTRFRQFDVTIEKIATLMSRSAPKGLLLVRDELAGWLLGLDNYNDAGRAFWIESYGGRKYVIERQKAAEPITVEHNAVGVTGGCQPAKLAELMRGADDGLLARFLWLWPESRPFARGKTIPDIPWATASLDRLRLLEMPPATDDGSALVVVELVEEGWPTLEEFGREMQDRQKESGGLMVSALAKARGHALRLALVLEFLWWAAEDGYGPPPDSISASAMREAIQMMRDYFLPMSERVYGDAALPRAERNAVTLARWIAKQSPEVVHVRTMQREARLPGLRTAADIHEACGELVEAGWLEPPPHTTARREGRAPQIYSVNKIALARLRER